MQSMTGYGRGYAEQDGSSVTIEISAVNHKQRDIRFTLPPELNALEGKLKKQVTDAITRGSLYITLEYNLAPEEKAEQIKVDKTIAGKVIQQLREIARHNDLPETITPDSLINVPGLLEVQSSSLPADKISQLAHNALIQAIDNLSSSRSREGESMATDLQQRIDRLSTMLDTAEKGRHQILNAYKKQLQKRIQELGINLATDDQRVVQEAAFAAQKSDISEELVRLRSHLNRFKEKLYSDDAVGRELYFVTQELLREINTLGSKTRDTEVADAAINFKTELDSIREQVLNIE